MITDAAEIRAVARCGRASPRRARSRRSDSDRRHDRDARGGADCAEQIAREADFLSIGTNDLTQYTLAMDRGHPAARGRLDALHPAVLRLISLAVEGGARARQAGRRVRRPCLRSRRRRRF